MSVKKVTMVDLVSRINVDAGLISPILSEKHLLEERKAFLDTFFSSVISHIAAGDEVHIKNFGKFSLRLTKESVRNPANNKVVFVDRRKRIKFESTVKAIDALNEKDD